MSMLKSPIILVGELVGINYVFFNGNEKNCVHLRWFINCNYVQIFCVFLLKKPLRNSALKFFFENVCDKSIFLSYNIIVPC